MAYTHCKVEQHHDFFLTVYLLDSIKNCSHTQLQPSALVQRQVLVEYYTK